MLFKEALANIVNNAINYAPESTAIKIVLTPRPKDHLVSVNNLGGGHAFERP